MVDFILMVHEKQQTISHGWDEIALNIGKLYEIYSNNSLIKHIDCAIY